MTTLVEQVEIVKSNVANNRKNIAAQVEALKVQMDSAVATINEMDALRALVEVALEDPQVVLAAEARVIANAAVIESESKVLA